MEHEHKQPHHKLTKKELKSRKGLRRMRRQKKQPGRCPGCGTTRPLVENRKRCAICLERDAAYSRRKYSRSHAAKKALGICTNSGCNRFATPGITQCDYHAEQRCECNERQRRKRRENGRCRQCGAAPEPGRARCTSCLRYQARAMAKYRKKRKLSALMAAS